jgi:hypothetical protein
VIDVEKESAGRASMVAPSATEGMRMLQDAAIDEAYYSSSSDDDDYDEGDGYDDDDDPMMQEEKENTKKLWDQQDPQESFTIRINTGKDKAATMAGGYIRYTSAIDILALNIVMERRPFAAPHGSKERLWVEAVGAINWKYLASKARYLNACGGKVTVENLRKRLKTLEHHCRKMTMDQLRRSGTQEKYSERSRAVEAYIDCKDTVKNADDATREHLKKTGELARREGKHLRDSLLQNMTRSRDLLDTDKADVLFSEHLWIDVAISYELRGLKVVQHLAKKLESVHHAAKGGYRDTSNSWLWHPHSSRYPSLIQPSDPICSMNCCRLFPNAIEN